LFIRRDDKAALEATNAGRTIAQSGGGRGLKKDMKQVGEWIDKAQQDRTTAGLKTAA
jgi:hypothetical protein